MMTEPFYAKQPDYESIRRMVYRIKAGNPQAKVFPIGRSVLGRGIFAVSIGGSQGATAFTGGVRAGDWLTTLLLFRFCENLLKAMEQGSELAGVDVNRAFESRSLVIIPCLNPDGLEIAAHGPETAGVLARRVATIASQSGRKRYWQANARGVDLNHNFDVGWQAQRQLEQKLGITGPAPARYGGSRPESEPETRALTGFCTANGVRQVYDFQTQGNMIYSGYGPHTPTRAQLMAEVLASSCGYKVCRPRGAGVHGGFAHWFVDKLHRPGFTFKVGSGRIPLTAGELEPIYARLVEAMVLAAMV